MEKAAEDTKNIAKGFAEQVRVPTDDTAQFQQLEKDYLKWKKKVEE